MTHNAQEPCIGCGVMISTDHLVSLATVMQLSKVRVSEYVNKIVEIEGISINLAQEYVDHKMHRNCAKSEPPCPNCGAALKTWHARHCLTCDWVRDASKLLPEY